MFMEPASVLYCRDADLGESVLTMTWLSRSTLWVGILRAPILRAQTKLYLASCWLLVSQANPWPEMMNSAPHLLVIIKEPFLAWQVPDLRFTLANLNYSYQGSWLPAAAGPLLLIWSFRFGSSWDSTASVIRDDTVHGALHYSVGPRDVRLRPRLLEAFASSSPTYCGRRKQKYYLPL
jgi:hypothetical protein